jgi:predicted Zn-dependent peptidase
VSRGGVALDGAASPVELNNLCREELPGGIRVLTEHLPQVESVSLGVWIASGVEHEPPGLEGVTHLLEHMLFKGTERRSAGEIARAIDGVGGQLNGFTDREYICLYARVLKAHVPLAADVLFDMLLHSCFDPEELKREKEVVVQEIEHCEDSPEELVHDLFVQRVWVDHPLGRSLLGREESVRVITREALLHHFHSQYSPDRILVTAAGNVDSGWLMGAVRESFASLSGRATEGDGGEPDFHPGEHFLSRPTEQVHFCLGTPGYSYSNDDRYALAALDAVLGGSPSSRLFQEIREKRGLVYHIGSYAQAFRRGGLFAISASTAPRHFPQVLQLVRGEVALLRERGLTEPELARAKEQMKGALALAWESTSFRMQHLATCEMYWGRVLPFREIADKISAVTLEQVRRVAGALFGEESLSLVAIGPFPQ